MVTLIASLKTESWQTIYILLVFLIRENATHDKVWSGNLQFTEDGWLHSKDIRDIQHEIQVTLLFP